MNVNENNLVDEGWYRLTTVLNYGVSNRPKKNLNSTPLILGFQIKPFATRWSGGKVQFRSCDNHSRRMLEKTIEENLSKLLFYVSKLHSTLRSGFCSLVSELKCDIGTNPHAPNWFLCKAADLNQWPVSEKGVSSDSNPTAQRLQMAAWVCKSLERMSGMILNQ